MPIFLPQNSLLKIVFSSKLLVGIWKFYILYIEWGFWLKTIVFQHFEPEVQRCYEKIFLMYTLLMSLVHTSHNLPWPVFAFALSPLDLVHQKGFVLIDPSIVFHNAESEHFVCCCDYFRADLSWIVRLTPCSWCVETSKLQNVLAEAFCRLLKRLPSTWTLCDTFPFPCWLFLQNVLVKVWSNVNCCIWILHYLYFASSDRLEGFGLVLAHIYEHSAILFRSSTFTVKNFDHAHVDLPK